MTRNEAIKYIRNVLNGREDKRGKTEIDIALEMAIEALEQEPCEDCVSRQVVIDCFKKWQPYMATRMFEFEKELKALPSVTQQPKMGRWIEHFDESGKWYECDQCHTDWGGPVNYCPNCGSKM